MTAALRNVDADVEVACAFGHSPSSDPAGWSWTDITAYVLDRGGVAIARGRRAGAPRVETSILSLDVDNSDGRFTPRLQSGAYYPDVRFRTPIRVRARSPKTSGTWRTRFTGFVDEWPIDWPGGTSDFAVSAIKASGVLRRISPADVTAPLAAQMSAVAPDAWWPLDDGRGALSYDSATSGIAAAVPDDVTRVVADAVPGPLGSQRNAPRFGDFGLLNLPSVPVAPLTVELWWQWGATDTSLIQLFGSGGYIGIKQGAARGQFTGYTSAYPTACVQATPVAGVGPGGSWWHCAFTVTGSGAGQTFTLYVNGASVATYTASHTAYTMTGGTVMHYSDGADAGVAAVAVHDTCLSAGQVLAQFNAGNGWVGETAGARLARVCNLAGVYDVASTAAEPMGVQPSGGLLDVLVDCAQAELGVLYETVDGALALAARSAGYNPAVWLALDASAGQARSLETSADDSRMANTVTATRPGGSAQTASDAASVAAYDVYSRRVEVNTADDAALARAAGWLAGLSADPELPRVPSMALDLSRLPSAATYLATDPVGARVTVSNAPSQLPGSAVDVVVDGYRERITAVSWTVDLECSPTAPLDRVFTVENAGDLSRVGVGLSFLDAATAAATSLVVSHFDGSQLTTAGGDLPLSLRNTNTGEVFSVSAVSGTNPQTLTVTRGQSGTTAKAITQWDPVELAVEPIIAL